jgi:thiosulfate/3-mercaptopyruvate sulfurtransferase
MLNNPIKCTRLHLGAGALALCFLAGCRQARPATDPYFPAREAPNYESLVSARWLKAALDFQQSNAQTPRPPTYRSDHLVILEASWAKLEEAKEYRRGHIPGAIHFNTDDLENGYPRWQLRSPAELRHAIGRHGITPQTTVVVYGNQVAAAARVWWALRYAGVADVRLLDGGFASWEAAGYARDTAVSTPRPASFDAPVRTEMLATTEYVRAHLNDPRVWLADVRSTAEFAGRVSGYEYVDFKGRIPAALHVGDGNDSARLYNHGDATLRSPFEVRAMWHGQGLLSTKTADAFDREVIFYCGSGWRSSVAYFHAWLLGYRNIRNYSDGWCGWSTDYQPDAEAKGGTPGWRQQRTGNPIVVATE